MLFNGIYNYVPSDDFDFVEDIEATVILPAPKRRRIHKNLIHEKTFASK